MGWLTPEFIIFAASLSEKLRDQLIVIDIPLQ